MKTTRIVLAGMLAALGLAGCLLGPLEGIPCADDAQCASDAFCDLLVGECQLGEPPNVQVTQLIGDEGEGTLDLQTVFDTDEVVLLELRNVGAAPADAVTLSVSPIACLAFEFASAKVPSSLEPGAVAAVNVAMHSRCRGQQTLDWFTEFSGRARRGIFNVTTHPAE